MAETYCVANFQKQHRSDVRHLQNEANRELAPERYKNAVDTTMSHRNVYLVRSDDWHHSIDEAVTRNGVTEDKNSVVLITTVYAASSEFWAEHYDDSTGTLDATGLAYFDACLEHARTRGEVINAVIHLDETNPHMQVATVPIVDVPTKRAEPVWETDADGNIVYETDANGDPLLDEDGYPTPKQAVYTSGKSQGKKKYKRVAVLDDDGNPLTHRGLNAAHIIGNKAKMSRDQTEFWEMCGKPFGLARGEIRVEDKAEATRRLTEAQYKAAKTAERADAAAQDVLFAAQDEAQAALAASWAIAEETRLQAELDAHEAAILARQEAEEAAASILLDANAQAENIITAARQVHEGAKADAETLRSKAEQERLDAHQLKEDAREAQARATAKEKDADAKIQAATGFADAMRGFIVPFLKLQERQFLTLPKPVREFVGAFSREWKKLKEVIDPASPRIDSERRQRAMSVDAPAHAPKDEELSL